VPYFKDDREVYAAFGRLFQELLDDDATARQFRRADGIVQWQYRNPRAEITTIVPAQGPTSVQLGAGDAKPDVIVAMDADTAHGFWLGRVNVVTALSAGQIKARGPVAKILALVPLVKLAVPHYEALLASLAAGGSAPPTPEHGVEGEEPREEVAEAAEPEGEAAVPAEGEGEPDEAATVSGPEVEVAAEPQVEAEPEPEVVAEPEPAADDAPAQAVE